jgi:hypothetical protein
MRKLMMTSAVAVLGFGAPAMADCPAGLSPTTSPACEVGTLKPVLADDTSNCFVVEVLESGHTWAISTSVSDKLIHGLTVHLIKGDLATLIGSGADAPGCGFPNPKQIGQVR